MGFSSIAKQAEQELLPMLPKIIPRLYRYQFDPNPQTALSMKNIWRSLVKDPVKALENYFTIILDDLLKSMGDRIWRTREASCAAMAELLNGKRMEKIEPYLKELWIMCFRAMDDIKESVRKAAFVTCKTLTNITVRYCDPNCFAPEKSQNVIGIVVPFLLHNGLGSMAEDVHCY